MQVLCYTANLWDFVPTVFFCVQTTVWQPKLGIFNLHTDVKTRNCTLGLSEHQKSLHRKSTVGEKSLAASGSTTCYSSLQVSMRNQRSHTQIYCYQYTKQTDSIKPEGKQGTDMVQLRSLPYKIRPCVPGSLQGYLKCRSNSNSK